MRRWLQCQPAVLFRDWILLARLIANTDKLWSRSQLADIPANKFPVGTALFMDFVIRKPAVWKEAICSIADTILQRSGDETGSFDEQKENQWRVKYIF